jgi:hypothetical protein
MHRSCRHTSTWSESRCRHHGGRSIRHAGRTSLTMNGVSSIQRIKRERLLSTLLLSSHFMNRAVHATLATMMKESPKVAMALPNHHDGSGGTAKQVYTSPSLTSSPNGNQSQHGSVSSKDSIASGSVRESSLAPIK